MKGATHRPLTPSPRRWCTGAALAAAVVVSGAVASGALAERGGPTDTTPTPTVTTPDPSVTVPAPDPGPVTVPVQVAPKPDPGPVKVVPKPKPQVVHPVYQPPAAPAVVVQPSGPAAKPTVAKPRVRPKHVVALHKHVVKPKRSTPTRMTNPKPAVAKPKSKRPAITLQHESARTSGGGVVNITWAKIAFVAGLMLVLLSGVLVATRRAARRKPGVAIAPDAAITSANGSSPVQHDEELAVLELELTAPAERADELATELAQFEARGEVIPEPLLAAATTANELRDSATVALRKARRLADRIVEEAARRRTRLEARNESLKLELKARAERADELAAELAQFRAREESIRETLLMAQKTATDPQDKAEVATLVKSLLGQVEAVRPDGAGQPFPGDPSIVS